MIDQAYLEKLNARVAALEAELSAPGTAANQKKFRALVDEHVNLRQVQQKAEAYLKLNRDLAEAKAMAAGTDAELREMARAELTTLEATLPRIERELQLALIPPDPDDSRNTIIEIRAGTGGEEAALFAGDLYRMYSRYCEDRGWRVSVIDASSSDLRGYKEIVFSVEGQDVYRVLRYESGGHRVQRIPETEANGRVHTSAATVAVLPEAEETDEVEIKADDLRIDTYRAGGAGGQHVNKTDSAVRITHLPTNIVVQCQDERSQGKNKAKAMKVLAARLLARVREAEQAKMADERRTQIGSGDRSDRIRTYNFPQNRVTDHRINLTLYNLDSVIEGQMDGLLNALHEADVTEKLKKQLATS
ncbi:MAG TPA: peptide chain release factor 1 [Kiritimatiellia bacterium]|jgi:peptide chain release factor 1